MRGGSTFKCECIQIQPQMQPHTYSQFITTVQLNYATGLPQTPQIFNNFSICTAQRWLLPERLGTGTMSVKCAEWASSHLSLYIAQSHYLKFRVGAICVFVIMQHNDLAIVHKSSELTSYINTRNIYKYVPTLIYSLILVFKYLNSAIGKFWTFF